ncbi:MAG: hypothetical protein IPG02_16235 [Ignavibacteria bacterium]|jgi:hypothetical protein|nr:hypothetical protein [Ignavibacteria bacterium]MBK9227583.1 hypothetical protein [Ignavibacteria bacterium]
MTTTSNTHTNRILAGVAIGILLLLLTAGASALSMFMVSLLVFGCVTSPPDWIYSIVFIGFPLPLIISSIIIPYMFIKKMKVAYIMITGVAGLIMSCMIFFVWFLILTRYC